MGKLDFQELLTTLRLNAAQGELKRSRWKEAIAFCNPVIAQEPNNVKALYRRGLARIELDDFKGAVDDLRHAATCGGANDVGVRRELVRAETLQRELVAKERAALSGVFDKLRKKDDETERLEELHRKAEEE